MIQIIKEKRKKGEKKKKNIIDLVSVILRHFKTMKKNCNIDITCKKITITYLVGFVPRNFHLSKGDMPRVERTALFLAGITTEDDEEDEE